MHSEKQLKQEQKFRSCLMLEVGISHKFIYKRIFLFTNASKNDCFTKVIQVVKYIFVLEFLRSRYIEQEALPGNMAHKIQNLEVM